MSPSIGGDGRQLFLNYRKNKNKILLIMIVATRGDDGLEEEKVEKEENEENEEKMQEILIKMDKFVPENCNFKETPEFFEQDWQQKQSLGEPLDL